MGKRRDNWQPTEFLRFEGSYPTSTGPARIVTDAGRAYIKALGNREGPHVLACEWIGANLARWIGLRTFDFAIMRVQPGDEIELGHGQMAEAGPAFVTRAERGHSWSGDESELSVVENKDDITGLIVFDTWVRNRDRFLGQRCHYDNVFLSSERTKGAARELVAMDHTHCISDATELTRKIKGIRYARDATVYGAFSEFRAFWSGKAAAKFLARLGEFDKQIARFILTEIPREWNVDELMRAATETFLVDRAKWLSAQSIEVFAAPWGQEAKEGGRGQ